MADSDSKDWSVLSALFDEFSDLPSPERQARIAALRARNAQLAARLEAMLAADAGADGPLERSLDDVAPMLHESLVGAEWETRAGQLMGRYRLIEPIGSGGMGEVWRAERADGEYRQDVALKLLKRGLDTEAVLGRFLQERAILARLTHPNIVRLLDGGMSDDGRPYYVMEHVAGEPVIRHAAMAALDVRERVELVIAIAQAVSYAHAQLVVHRDLKPSNILIDAQGAPHLLDFGIAKLLEESGEQTLTGTGVRVMSPAYAAPEQILGEPVGTATDVYALGVILFELLTGELPHRRASRDPSVLAVDLTADSERPSQALARSTGAVATYADVERRRVLRQVSGDLDLIVGKALRRDPLRRYPTMAAFADDLRRWADGRAIMARADSARYRTATFIRRHRVGVLATALVFLALLGGMSVALWQAGIARDQAARAEQQAMRAERVKEFLISLFRHNDPVSMRGRSMTAAQIMAEGVKGLSVQLADDPETRAELLVAIAEIQYNLSEQSEGFANADQAIDLYVGAIAADDPRMARAYQIRGKHYTLIDRPVDAEADLRRALAILATQPDADSDQIDDINHELAGVLRFTASLPEATALQRQVVESSARRHGAESEAVAEKQMALALNLEEMSQFDEAEALYRKALPLLDRVRGPLDPWTCNSKSTFAGLLDRIGKRDEAAQVFQTALDCQRQLFGEGSPTYGRTLFSRGILMIGLQRFTDAEADFRHALASFEPGDYNTGHANRYLGQALMGQSRFAEAAELFLQAERIYRALNLPADAQQWRSRADYAFAKMRMGELAEARAAIDAAVAGMTPLLDANDFVWMRALLQHGQIAREQGDVDAALASHRRGRALALELMGERSREAADAGHQLALDLAARGDAEALEEAESLMAHVVTHAHAEKLPALAEYEKSQREVAAAARRVAARVR